jgi:hypothetical protein
VTTRRNGSALILREFVSQSFKLAANSISNPALANGGLDFGSRDILDDRFSIHDVKQSRSANAPLKNISLAT